MKKLTDDLVQAIVVCPREYSSLEDMLSDAAITSILSSHDDPSFKQWYETGQRKTARRVKTVAKLDKIGDIYHQKYHHVVAAPLMHYDEFASPVSKAQVSGWKEYDRIYGDDHDVPSFGTFLVNDQLDMSPGKLAAQVSHSLTIYYVRTGELPSIDDTIRLELVSEKEVMQCDDVVVDAGHTEIPSGSVTCGFVPVESD